VGKQESGPEKIISDMDVKKPRGKAGKPRNADADEWTRQTFLVRKDFLEKLRALSYWNRQTTKVVLDTALEEFFKDKDIKPLP
jgi:hypothetical protein